MKLIWRDWTENIQLYFHSIDSIRRNIKFPQATSSENNKNWSFHFYYDFPYCLHTMSWAKYFLCFFEHNNELYTSLNCCSEIFHVSMNRFQRKKFCLIEFEHFGINCQKFLAGYRSLNNI